MVIFHGMMNYKKTTETKRYICENKEQKMYQNKIQLLF